MEMEAGRTIDHVHQIEQMNPHFSITSNNQVPFIKKFLRPSKSQLSPTKKGEEQRFPPIHILSFRHTHTHLSVPHCRSG